MNNINCNVFDHSDSPCTAEYFLSWVGSEKTTFSPTTLLLSSLLCSVDANSLHSLLELPVPEGPGSSWDVDWEVEVSSPSASHPVTVPPPDGDPDREPGTL